MTLPLLQDLASWSLSLPQGTGTFPAACEGANSLCVGCAAVLPLPPLSNRQFCSCRSLRCALKCHRTCPSETCTSSSSQAITTQHSLARNQVRSVLEDRLGPCSKSAKHGYAVAGGPSAKWLQTRFCTTQANQIDRASNTVLSTSSPNLLHCQCLRPAGCYIWYF